MKKAKIAVLVSGGGTNLQALLDAQAAGLLPHGQIALVVSSNAGAYALTRAANANIPAKTLSPKLCGGQEAFEEALSCLLAEHEIDLIVLAGFLTILSANFTSRWPSRILNVHPSLIPSFCGAGMYGLKVHKAALSAGVKVTGATVHFVNEVLAGNGAGGMAAIATRGGNGFGTNRKGEWQCLILFLFCGKIPTPAGAYL